MSLLVFIILGLVAGWLASIIMKTDSQQGPLLDIVLGMVGAFVGGILMNIFGQSSVVGVTPSRVRLNAPIAASP